MLPPLIAFAIQAFLWGYIQPYVWFFFYPAVFFSSWIGGKRWGIAATLFSAWIVWWAFMLPRFSVKTTGASGFLSVFVFIFMGILFSLFQENLRKARTQAEAALDKVRELDAVKSRLFTNVSHELRTPLALILGPTEQMLLTKELTPGLRHSLEIVDRNAHLLYRQVTDLLDVARLESGRLQPTFAPLDLAKAARTAASHFESLGENKHIHFICDVPESLAIEGDGAMIQRVLLNLLSNAFKFTPSGGHIRLAIQTENGHAAIQVHDTGPGVPEPFRERIFERFEQVEGGPERSFGGTGLGLAIVKEFALLHHGRAFVQPGPEGGSIFTVTIPLRAPQGTPLTAPPPDPDLPLERQMLEELCPQVGPLVGNDSLQEAPLVLVAEDNPDLRDYLVELLQPHYRVELAQNGHEGLDKAVALHPDLILTDVMMPGMSGDRMIQHIRSHSDLDATPIIVLTAKQDEALLIRLFQLGAQDCIYKPFSNKELLARVRSQLAERKRADETAFFQKSLYEAVAQSLPAGGLCVVNPKLTFLIASGPLVQTLTGIQGCLEGRSLEETVIEEHRESLKACFQKALAGETLSHETQIEDLFLWTQYLPIRDSSGQIIAAMALSLNITARKRAELSLLGSEARYFGIFQNMTAGFARCRLIEEEGHPLDFEYLEVNPAFEKLTGLHEAVGKRASSLIPGIQTSNPELFQTYGRVARLAIPERFETYVAPLDIWFSVNVYCPAFGEFIAIFDNITEQKHAEIALREATGRLELAAHSAGLGVWDWDLQTNRMVWDDRMFDLYGYRKPDWPGGFEAWQQRLHPEDRKAAIAESQAALESKRPYHSEFRIIREDGSIRHLVADATVLADHQGKAIRMIGLNRDVTEQKLAEAERNRMEREMIQTQKLESLGSLAGGIAHDMNNVLSAILGLTTLLQAKQGADAAMSKTLGTIEHAALRGRDLVKSLTEFVRKDLEQATLLDLNTLVTKEIDILRLTTRQRITLEVDQEPGLGWVFGEGGTLGSALMNLCINAIDAMPEGGTLRLKTRSLPNNYVAILVEDTGEGMSPETLARAVEPFYTTKPIGKGTGLGLSMVHNTAKNHGGRLDIQSQLGVGTTITLALPVAQAAPETQASAPEILATRCRALHILLVDDDELICASTPPLLEQLGHEVQTVGDGGSALATLESKGPFDLVILDHNMPGMTGIQVLDQIKEHRPNQCVMMATGFRDSTFEEGLSRWPGTLVLSKPYSQRDLRDKLDSAFLP